MRTITTPNSTAAHDGISPDLVAALGRRAMGDGWIDTLADAIGAERSTVARWATKAKSGVRITSAGLGLLLCRLLLAEIERGALGLDAIAAGGGVNRLVARLRNALEAAHDAGHPDDVVADAVTRAFASGDEAQAPLEDIIRDLRDAVLTLARHGLEWSESKEGEVSCIEEIVLEEVLLGALAEVVGRCASPLVVVDGCAEGIVRWRMRDISQFAQFSPEQWDSMFEEQLNGEHGLRRDKDRWLHAFAVPALAHACRTVVALAFRRVAEAAPTLEDLQRRLRRFHADVVARMSAGVEVASADDKRFGHFLEANLGEITVRHRGRDYRVADLCGRRSKAVTEISWNRARGRTNSENT